MGRHGPECAILKNVCVLAVVCFPFSVISSITMIISINQIYSVTSAINSKVGPTDSKHGLSAL